MMNLKGFSEEDICDLYLTGTTLNKCAIFFGINSGTIFTVLKNNGIYVKSKSEAYGITKEIEEKVVSLYKEKESLVECAKILYMNRTTIKNILVRNGVKILSRKKFKVDSKIEKQILNLYSKGFSGLSCDTKLGLPHNTSISILKKNGIKVKEKSTFCRKYNFNERYFEKIDTPAKAYFLGLIVADGNNRRGGLRINLQIEDGYILNLLRKEMRHKGKLITLEKRPPGVKKQKLFRANSFKLSEDLIRWGVIPAKSHFTYFPDIPEEFWSHFIRGVFDGDGTVGRYGHYNSVMFSILGNIDLIKRINDILVEKCNLDRRKLSNHKNHTENIVSLNYAGDKQVIKIYEYLYKDCGNLFLKRKKKKFKWKN